LLDRFYHATSNVLVASASWIDKLVGDEVMALYIPAMGADYRARSVRAGIQILHALGYAPGTDPWLPVGVGIHAGNSSTVKDCTVAYYTSTMSLSDNGSLVVASSTKKLDVSKPKSNLEKFLKGAVEALKNKK
jgi:hypothetical protein